MFNGIRRLPRKWQAALTGLFVLIAAVAGGVLLASTARSASADGWAGWPALDTVSVLAPSDPYISEAATELRDSLSRSSGRQWKVVQGDVSGPAIRLSVKPSEPRLQGANVEGFWIRSDEHGISITGKSPIAVRHGAFTLLEKVGYRWFFKHDAWTVTPTSLKDIGPVDEVKSPAFEYRLIWHTSIDDGGYGKIGQYTEWKHYNRLDAERNYEVVHSYDQILKASDSAAPNSAFCPSRSAVWPRQLDPRNAYVAEKATSYARVRMALPPTAGVEADIKTLMGAVSVSPNDGAGWCADLAADPQLLTNSVFGLANKVARNLKTEFPDRFVGVYSYSDYDLLPTIPLEPNVLVEVVNFGKHSIPYNDRIKGFAGKGVKLGVYDYYDVPQWNLDRPPVDFHEILARIPFYAANNVDVFTAEAGDGWGARGLLYYVTARLMWEPNASVDGILSDFYSSAFGPAAPPMKRYYERLLAGDPVTERSVALSFKDLAEAEKLAGGNGPVLERVRQAQYYARYMWLRMLSDQGKLDTAGLKKLYDLVYKLRGLYVLHFPIESARVESSLQKAGVPQTVIDALEIGNPPTADQAKAWMQEALAAFGSVDAVDSAVVESVGVTFSASGMTGLPQLSPISIMGDKDQKKEILVAAKAGTTVTVDVEAYWDRIFWKDPQGNVLDTRTANPWPSKGSLKFFAPKTGNYLLSVWGRVTKISAPAGVQALPNEPGWLDGKKSAYFNVPSGTPSLVVGIQRMFDAKPTITVLDAAGKTAVSGACADLSKNTCEWAVRNPAPGIWRVDYDFGNKGSDLYLLGVPPLVWHDAASLAIATSASASPAPTPTTAPQPATPPTATPAPAPAQAPAPAPQPPAAQPAPAPAPELQTPAPTVEFVIIATPEPPTATPPIASGPTATPTVIPTAVPTATPVPPTPTPSPKATATATPVPPEATPTPAPSPEPVATSVVLAPTAAPIVEPVTTPEPASEPAPGATSVTVTAPVETAVTVIPESSGDAAWQTLDLEAGWNLVSFNVVPQDPSIINVLGPIWGSFTEVSTLVGGKSLVYRQGEPWGRQTLQSIEPRRGYWVRLTESATLRVNGKPADPGIPIEIVAGWNLVGYVPDAPMAVDDALKSIKGLYTEVRGFEVEGRSYLPTVPEELATLQVLQPGFGYLIHATGPGLLRYPSQ